MTDQEADFKFEIYENIKNKLEKHFQDSINTHPDFREFSDKQMEIIYDDPLYNELSLYHTGKILGIKETYFYVVQNVLVEWKYYYKDKGKIVTFGLFTDDITIPLRMLEKEITIQEAHFWKDSTDFWDYPDNKMD